MPDPHSPDPRKTDPHNTDPHNTEPHGSAPQGGTRLKIIAIGAAAAVFIGGAVGFQAIADTKVYQHAKLAVTEAHWGGHRGHRDSGGLRGGFANLTDAELEDRIDRLTRHMAIEIDATDEQQARIAGIATGVAKELRPVRARFHAAGKEIGELLLKDEIDRAAVEALRAERIADLEAISKTVSEGLLDVAETLTPEQRVLLEERIEEYGFKRRGRRG